MKPGVSMDVQEEAARMSKNNERRMREDAGLIQTPPHSLSKAHEFERRLKAVDEVMAETDRILNMNGKVLRVMAIALPICFLLVALWRWM